ncbi:MAG: hypothetical protein V3V89_04940, partial [Gammaproteobacteria bacterium]
LMTGLERISVDFAAHIPPRKSVYIELYLNQLVKNHPVCECPLWVESGLSEYLAQMSQKNEGRHKVTI